LGIGLTLVRLLVALHGGTVRAESLGAGLGSTFTVELPVAEKAAKVAASSRSTLRSASTARRILVVDDNEDAALLLAKLLKALGHEVEFAGDAAQALQVIKTFKPHVGVLDIGLPVMDGYELAIKLREELAPEALQLIAVTGYGQQNDLARSAKAGFRAHLVKPVDMRQLIATIETIASSRPAQSAVDQALCHAPLACANSTKRR
jgi:CheY-like chemotaxis protein